LAAWLEVLKRGSANSSANIQLARWRRPEGMQGLGYVEGRDFDTLYRYADNDPARMPELARELTQLKPTVFVTATVAGTFAIRQATAAIPIVNPALTDPVGFGFVQSQARPGGQVTGIMATMDSLLV
jgi:putative tryptophan/tyrosine transport system substrate-binding protein